MSAGTCNTPGCFNTTYDSEYCGKCLGGETPSRRGKVTYNEAFRAKAIGGLDLAITADRMMVHGQPVDILQRTELPAEVRANVDRALTRPSQRKDSAVPGQKVFLSYAREDAASVKTIYDALMARGHKPWLDSKNLLPGQHWEPEIQKAVKDSDYFVALLSSNSVNKRGFVQAEIRLGLRELERVPEHQIFFIPVRLEPCEVPSQLEALHFLDFQESNAIERLLLSIEEGAKAQYRRK